MKQTLPILGMACTGCAALVEKTLRDIPGVHGADVSLASRQVLIDYDEHAVTLPQMRQAVGQAGYDLVIEQDADVEAIEHTAWHRQLRRTLTAWALTLVTWGLALYAHHTQSPETAQWALITSLVCIILCGGSFYTRAWHQITHRALGMDTLVALSTLITTLFNAYATLAPSATTMAVHACYDTPAMILAFVLTGKLLEEKARKGAAGSIRHLMQLAPRTAHILRAQSSPERYVPTDDIPIAAVAPGDRIEVRPGERIPVDGIVLLASSYMTADAAYVDQSMMNGEPTPVPKRKGDTLLAGTLLQQGTLHLTAISTGAATSLARMIATVQQAQSSKAPVQRLVDKVAARFVPSIAAIALLTFLIWWAVGGTALLPRAILSAVSVLVIACPCAMGLATPAALMVGIGKAAEAGILIKDATALERLRCVRAIILDKTGTITVPTPTVDFTKADALSPGERETLKPGVPETVSQLHQMGISVHLMSGDKESAVSYWADAAGIRHWQHGVTTDDKANLVQELQATGTVVAMVGDGINDTQALARADVSIAMGQGTDVAMDVAQVTLTHGDLRTLPLAIHLSRCTVRCIRQNLFWAFIYNAVCIPLAAGLPLALGIPLHITPATAAALMALSSISVLLNSLRLQYGHASTEHAKCTPNETRPSRCDKT